MKYTKITLLFLGLWAAGVAVYAGNDARVGQAGASELLINPWARSSGFMDAYSSGVRGIEATRLNIAGLAFTRKTEGVLAFTDWLSGTDIRLTAAGISQSLGEGKGVLGLSFMSMNFGEIDVVTTDAPDFGTGATFRPQFTNIALAYSKSFSNSIHGGILLHVINHSIADVRATGVAFDAGIQYVAGEKDRAKFGISLRNVGSPMRFRGDGLDFTITDNVSGTEFTLSQRPDDYELPSQLNIGGSYDFLLGENLRFTTAGNFSSNSFRSDYFSVGAELAFKEQFMLRAGYRIEPGRKSEPVPNNNLMTGLGAGVSIQVPLKKESESTFAFDYSYRATSIFKGIHSLGVRIAL